MSNPYGNPPRQGPQDGPPAAAAPIVWQDQGPAASAPWTGPGAFTPPAPPRPAPSPDRPVPPTAQSVPPPEATPRPAPDRPAAVPADEPAAGPPAVGAAEQSADDEALTIGRARGNSIVLDDMLVSRRHVRITADDEGLLLEDLGSRNGTFLNGRRVERTHLHEGDRIGVGSATFEVRDGWLVTV